MNLLREIWGKDELVTRWVSTAMSRPGSNNQANIRDFDDNTVKPIILTIKSLHDRRFTWRSKITTGHQYQLFEWDEGDARRVRASEKVGEWFAKISGWDW